MVPFNVKNNQKSRWKLIEGRCQFIYFCNTEWNLNSKLTRQVIFILAWMFPNHYQIYFQKERLPLLLKISVWGVQQSSICLACMKHEFDCWHHKRGYLTLKVSKVSLLYMFIPMSLDQEDFLLDQNNNIILLREEKMKLRKNKTD